MGQFSPCTTCGRTLHTGEGRVLIAFTANELFEMATEVVDSRVKARLICALGLVDAELAGQASHLSRG